MRSDLLCAILLGGAALAAPAIVVAQANQPVQAGQWISKVTARELDIPGAPGFLLRMARGKSKTEKKCLTPAQAAGGIGAFLAPDAKAKCSVERQQIVGNRFEQVMSCPNKKAGTMRVERAGTFTATSVQSRIVMSGQTEKGPMRIVADQQSSRTAATCK